MNENTALVCILYIADICKMKHNTKNNFKMEYFPSDAINCRKYFIWTSDRYWKVDLRTHRMWTHIPDTCGEEHQNICTLLWMWIKKRITISICRLSDIGFVSYCIVHCDVIPKHFTLNRNIECLQATGEDRHDISISVSCSISFP